VNRLVQYLNFFGVLALAALCVVQWRQNRTLNLEVNRLEKTHQAAAQKLLEREKDIHGLTSDLALLKEQVGLTHSNLTEVSSTLRATEHEHRQIMQERDQLKESVTAWANAVTARDERLKESNQQIVLLSGQLNDSIRKHNTLASNYNSVVKQLEETRRRLESGTPQPAPAAK
jgi:chromosome segregation ATPase